MTDPSDPDAADAFGELLAVVLEQAEEVASLDAARAEAWASDVLALAAETGWGPEELVDALTAVGDARATTALVALSGLHDGIRRPVDDGPSWTGAIGTSRCEGAWVLRARGSESIAFRFVDSFDERHVIMADLLVGPPETVGEVVVGPGDLLDALQEEDARIEPEAHPPAALADRCVAALGLTDRPAPSAVANGRLLLRRLGGLTAVDVEPPVFAEDDVVAAPPRDRDDDAHALGILVRALGGPNAAPPLGDTVDVVASFVAPRDLAPFAPAERDAVLILESADWLGAVIGLVRAGVGRAVDGETMVDLVNRCPEVTTTIPKADRARIEWAFSTVIAGWDGLGIVADGCLTELGVAVLPAALHRAWA